MKWLLILCVLFLPLLVACATQESTPEIGSTTNEVTEQPAPQNIDESGAVITLRLDIDGAFADGWPWTLEMGADRNAKLTIHAFPDKIRRSFHVTQEQIDELATVLVAERYFELNNAYGELVPDGGSQTIMVTLGEQSNTVELNYFMNWANYEPERLPEPARGVSVWMHIRQWFDDAEAVNLKRYDQMVVDADQTRR